MLQLDVKKMEQDKKLKQGSKKNVQNSVFRIRGKGPRKQRLYFFKNNSYYNLKGRARSSQNKWSNLQIEPENFDKTLSYQTFYG